MASVVLYHISDLDTRANFFIHKTNDIALKYKGEEMYFIYNFRSPII